MRLPKMAGSAFVRAPAPPEILDPCRSWAPAAPTSMRASVDLPPTLDSSTMPKRFTGHHVKRSPVNRPPRRALGAKEGAAERNKGLSTGFVEAEGGCRQLGRPPLCYDGIDAAQGAVRPRGPSVIFACAAGLGRAVAATARKAQPGRAKGRSTAGGRTLRVRSASEAARLPHPSPSSGTQAMSRRRLG